MKDEACDGRKLQKVLYNIVQKKTEKELIMDLMLWFWIVLSALCWGIYPVLEKTVIGVHPAWVSALLVIGSVFTGSLGLLARPAVPMAGNALKILFCGAIMGIGMLVFGKIQVYPNLDVGKVFPIILGLMCIVTAASGALFLGESFPATKVAGLAIIVIGVYVIS